MINNNSKEIFNVLDGIKKEENKIAEVDDNIPTEWETEFMNRS